VKHLGTYYRYWKPEKLSQAEIFSYTWYTPVDGAKALQFENGYSLIPSFGDFLVLSVGAILVCCTSSVKAIFQTLCFLNQGVL
jgi:hypothetical protein